MKNRPSKREIEAARAVLVKAYYEDGGNPTSTISTEAALLAAERARFEEQARDWMMAQRLTKEQAAIIGAYTGILCGPFGDIHGYAEKVLGRPIWTHEFSDEKIMAALRLAAKSDFLAICYDLTKGDKS